MKLEVKGIRRYHYVELKGNFSERMREWLHMCKQLTSSATLDAIGFDLFVDHDTGRNFVYLKTESPFHYPEDTEVHNEWEKVKNSLYAYRKKNGS